MQEADPFDAALTSSFGKELALKSVDERLHHDPDVNLRSPTGPEQPTSSKSADIAFARIRSRVAASYVALALAVVNGCLAFAALNIVAWAFLVAFPQDPITLTYGPRYLKVVHPGRSTEEIRELLRETWSRPVAWEPFTNSRERPFRGRFVNVSRNGFRLSANEAPWPPDRSRTNIFVFGGSTTFGYGVSDEETIVAQLQRFLDERLGPRRAACYNFGQGSYYSSVERAQFQELLVAGTVPHVAVFIDGLNEFAFGAPFLSESLRRAVNKPSTALITGLVRQMPLSRLVARLKARPPEEGQGPLRAALDDPALLDSRIRRYLANRRLISASAAAHGVRPLFVWQPIPTYRYNPRYHLFGALGVGKNGFSGPGYARMADRLSREPPAPDFLWLADIQEGLNLPLYVDQVHYSAAMCGLIADKVGQALLFRGLLEPPAPDPLSER